MLIAKPINEPLMRLIAHTMRGSRGVCGGWGWQGVRDPLKNLLNIGFLSDTGPDSLKNHIATKPAFNVWPSSAYRCSVDDGPLIMVFGSSHQLTKGGKTTPSEDKKSC